MSLSEEVEVSWAIKYAEERKLRIELQKRLGAMIFEAGPLLEMTETMLKELLLAITDEDFNPDKLLRTMMKVIDFGTDLDVQIKLNMVNPIVGNLTESFGEAREQEILRQWVEEDKSPPQEFRQEFSEAMKIKARAARADWNKLAEQYGLKDTKELRDEARNDFAKIAGATILDLLNKKKEVNDSIIH
jgi:hypothetical protein